MTDSFYDPEINKTYFFENEYELQIKLFADKHQCLQFDDEAIEFALSLKKELIDELDKDSSKSDKIRCEHIKWIEKYLDGIQDFLIQQKMDVPKVLENHKSFIYRTSKRDVGRPKGKGNKLTIKKYNWVRDKHHFLMDKSKVHTIEESARLIRSQLKKEKPDFWDDDIYALSTIVDIIKKQKWGD